MTNTYSILLLGFENTSESFASGYFTRNGHRVISAVAGPMAAQALKDPQINLVYLQALPGQDAIGEFRRVKEVRSNVPVVLAVPQLSAQILRDAWHSEAADAIEIPVTEEKLSVSFKRAVRQISELEKKEPEEVQARFRYLDETGKERWVSLVPPRFSIGRSSTNDLVLPQMNVSRNHAEVVIQDNEYTVRDLGSKHGTFLNGQKVEQQARISSGDRVQIGGMQGPQLTFHVGDLLQSLLGSSEGVADSGLSVRGFREIGMLFSTFRALSSIPLVDDLLALVVDTAIELTGAERGFVMLKEEGDQLTFRCARNAYKKPLDGASFKTSRRVPDEVFKTGQRVVINDLDMGEESGDHSSTRRLGLRSIFCVPLKYLAFHEQGNQSGIGRMEIIGVLYVDSQSIGAGLSNTQLDALETLASEAAMAIYNARLYKDSQEKRKMDEELAIAREIQQALLPDPIRIISFVSAHSQNYPCREVGGDYFDYFEMEDGRFGFALGDVAGKGTPAALLTSMIQGMFSASALLDLPLPAMITNINRNLVRRGTGNRFVTFFFGMLEEGGNCEYVNAGHNPPYVVSPDGILTELKEGGMVLGLFQAAQYQSGTVKLNPGDHVVLFTDGVVEARNMEGDEFGEDRLRSLLQENCKAPASLILARLKESIASFVANAPQHDDITMMVLGYKE
jgi:phosphoserine phosphatase RsbU/P